MKALICHNSYRNTSGEDLVIATDVQTLSEHGVSVRTYERSNRETDSISWPQMASFASNTIYSRRSLRELTKLCEDYEPDVALVQNVFPLISPSAYYALHRCGVPIVQLVYNYRLICPNAILFTNGRLCERCTDGNFAHAVVHKCYRNSRALSALYATTLAVHRYIGDLRHLISAYITPDQFLRRKLVQGGFPEERIFALHNPFDVSRYTACYEHQGYFVYCGRLVAEKGIFTLLKAMRTVPHLRLVVVGSGEASEEARRVAAAECPDNVSFTGPKYDGELTRILRSALAVVVPTEWFDNSPLVIHQAFALGKPVIASEIDGIPEVVEHGRHGLLFPPGDDAALADRMCQLATNEGLRAALSRNARAKAELEFTSRRRFDGLMDVIGFARTHTLP